MTELTPQQNEAIDRIAAWYQDATPGFSEPFRLFGPAGTGKTTLSRNIGERLDITPVFGAYTGKAAKVLTNKGCPATTIHSAIYRPIGNAETRHLLDEARLELEDMEHDAASGDPTACGWADATELAGAMDELRERIESLERESRTVGFELNPDSEWGAAPLIVLDEVSMVNAKLAADIESFGVPVLVLGDPAQLPPVDGGGHYTTAEPDYELTEIHRQALDSPVLALATRVRTSRTASLGLTDADISRTSLAEAMAADQIIVWKNATRWSLTQRIRAALGRPDGQVVAGDRVMCLTNNKDLGVLNGTQYEVLEVEPAPLGPTMTLRELDSDQPPRRIAAYAEGFRGLEWEKAMKSNFQTYKGQRGAFTFANVITCHKAQGSEWAHVYVVDQSSGVIAMARKDRGPAAAVEQGRAWLYTAVTRASEKVTIARTGGR